MSLSIRDFTVEDIQTVSRLEAEFFQAPWSETMLFSACSRSDFFGVVAVDGEETVGYVFGTCLFEESELNRIAVLKNRRGEKIGGKLLDAFINKAKSLGAERMFLEVRIHNVCALRLYESRGFERLRVRKKYYSDGEDAFDMKKQLK